MPDWNKAEKDEFGFPINVKGKMTSDEKLQYLLEEIVALQLRIQSIENDLSKILQLINKK